MTRVRGVALLAAATTLVFAAGCSGSGNSTGTIRAAIEKPDLNVAVVPALDDAGFFVALYEDIRGRMLQ